MEKIAIASINAASKIRQINSIHHMISEGTATLDISTLTLTVPDACADQVRLRISDINSAFAAPTESDPLASDAQTALLRSLRERGETQIMGLRQIDLSVLTRSQASRLIDCARDIIANGY